MNILICCKDGARRTGRIHRLTTLRNMVKSMGSSENVFDRIGFDLDSTITFRIIVNR